MFQRLGEFVSRRWQFLLVFWALLLIGATGVTKGWINKTGFLPPIKLWDDVTQDGEFAFLPRNMPSLKGEELLKEAFPQDLLASSVVVVVRRESQKLDDADMEFIDGVLVPQLRAMQDEEKSLVARVRSFSDSQIGRLLISRDKKASLVIVELTTEFLEHRNRATVNEIQAIVEGAMTPAARPREGTVEARAPAGLHMALYGTAAVGKDMNEAAAESASATEMYTIVLVLLLLLIIYRAPALIFIPLLSVFLAVELSQALMIFLAQVPWLGFLPFEGLKTYVTVVTYGAGVDYCLFLIARYKEELDGGSSYDDAVRNTLAKVGDAVTASAATVACGIGMMVFAQFGKFQQAGKGMALSLIIMLVVALTFTPAMLRLLGSIAFWPYGPSTKVARHAGWISGTNIFVRWFNEVRLDRIWDWVGDAVMRAPGRIWLACVAVMVPFAVLGVVWHGWLSYGLLSELPRDKQSVIGAKAVQDHFPAGEAGPVTVLLENPNIDFSSPDARIAVRELSDRLSANREKLGINDVRSIYYPWGLHQEASRFELLTARAKAIDYYVSTETQEHAGHVTRLHLVLERDPFSRDSIQQLGTVEQAISNMLPRKGEETAEGDILDVGIDGSKVYMVGATASMRDLKTVTDQDQIYVDALVLLVVFLILWILLRKFSISAYLILSVFFSYFVALGVTFAVFYALDPVGFSGLDWKVPMFLFTILIAVGEDYNIFLMTRIDEEQRVYGPVEGVRVALRKTGSIISSCGIIMAGTFCSLVLAGSLVGMQQLGFALAFGVLLDTFVVRPVLVPAYLIMLHSGRFGAFGPMLGSLAPRPELAKVSDTRSGAA